jgi:hypothetical protein
MNRLWTVAGRAIWGLLLIACAATARAQDAAAYRGAWIADDAGARHVLYLVVRDGKVSGTHCFDCYDPDNLAFVDDGRLDAGGLHFNLYHSSAAETAYVERVDARLVNGELQLTLSKPGSEVAMMTLRRDTVRKQPAPPVDTRANQRSGGQARTLPGPAETLSAESVLGLWLWGTGPGKQYFMFKRHKDGIRGMVCGPCVDAEDFAPLEGIIISGSNFHFDIVHEDNGIGFEEHGPFNNLADAQIAMNEMLMTAVASFDPNGRRFEMTLLGPTQFRPPVQP